MLFEMLFFMTILLRYILYVYITDYLEGLPRGLYRKLYYTSLILERVAGKYIKTICSMLLGHIVCSHICTFVTRSIVLLVHVELLIFWYNPH